MNIILSIANLARRTLPTRPDPSYLISLGSTTAGVSVTSEEDALSYSAVWSCVRVIAETVAALPWHVFRREGPDRRKRVDNHPVALLLNSNPCFGEMTPFAWREQMVAKALLWGDAFAEVERDQLGRPVALWPIEPHRVSLGRDDAGALVYEIDNEAREPTRLFARDVYHVHGLGPSGLRGYYVVALFREAIGLGLATEAQASSFFGNAGVPSGFLKHPGKISEPAAKELVKRFEARHGGPRRRARVGLLQGGLEYEPAAVNNEDSELNTTRTTQVLEAARIFRVPPHKVCELSRATFSNISEQETAFGRDTVLPWAKRFEQEADQKLFLARNRQLFYTRLNLDGVMRGDPTARAGFYEVMERIGAMSVNEIRAKEELDPIGPDGDQYLIPSNFTTLERLAEPPPEPAPIPAAFGGEPEDAEADDQPEATNGKPNAAAALRPIALDLAAWIGRKAARDLGNAPADDGEWLADYGRRCGGLLAERIRPIAATYCQLAGLPESLASEASGPIGRDLADVLLGYFDADPSGKACRELALGWPGRAADWILDRLEKGAADNGHQLTNT